LSHPNEVRLLSRIAMRFCFYSEMDVRVERIKTKSQLHSVLSKRWFFDIMLENMDKKDFYLKRIGKKGKIKIWLVDGSKIRQDLDREFTNFGQHFRFPFIPKYEFWLDKEAVFNERRFFIDHLLIEWQLMKNGYSYDKALRLANKKELSERKKTEDFKKIIDKKGIVSVNKVHCRFLKKINNKISIWLVRGRLVRSVLDINFTEGGHDLVYNYIPKNEVWLDNDISAKERIYIILHELYERSLMEQGFTYSESHKKASRIEWQSRHNKEKLRENLAQVGLTPLAG